MPYFFTKTNTSLMYIWIETCPWETPFFSSHWNVKVLNAFKLIFKVKFGSFFCYTNPFLCRYDCVLAGHLYKRCSDSNKWLLRWFRLYQVRLRFRTDFVKKKLGLEILYTFIYSFIKKRKIISESFVLLWHRTVCETDWRHFSWGKPNIFHDALLVH